jgi:porin
MACGATALFVCVAPFARAEGLKGALSSFAKQRSLTDTENGPKEQLRRVGINADVWVTQFYQGQPRGDGVTAPDARTWRYGGKMDAFLRADLEKLGFLPGFHVNAQYEHYFGRSINSFDYALLPVNTAQAFVRKEGYHSALSLSATQDMGEHLSISVGKFNMMTLASQTPLVGGGGLETFMNRGLAMPSTGVGVTSSGIASDRLIASAPYLIGGIAVIKAAPFNVMLMLADPRSAQIPRTMARPFEKGVAFGGAITMQTDLFGLRGWHALRGAISNARGFDLEDAAEVRARLLRIGGPLTKKGFRFASYSFQQNLFQSDANPSQGWGVFALATLSDGNPTPTRWSMFAGVGGANLMEGREDDRWGVGYFHYAFSHLLISGLAARKILRQGESGVEAFYNFAVTPALRLSADVQFVDPWNSTKSRATYTALRMQTRF